MVFLVRKMRMMARLNRFKVVVVTDRTDLQAQLGATAQLSGEAARPTDEDLKSREIFGDFIDKYILQEAELDGATVPILYEGRTADSIVKDAPSLDAVSQHTTRKPEKIEVRDLGFRWGSCGKGGVVYFNWKALQLPVRLVDYIIVHELVHLVEGHHGPEFWQALGRAMPDWQKRKDALADEAKDYLVFGLPSGRAASRLGAVGEK
jgi:hypothetical protein